MMESVELSQKVLRKDYNSINYIQQDFQLNFGYLFTISEN